MLLHSYGKSDEPHTGEFSLVPRPSVNAKGGSGEFSTNFWTPRNFGSKDLIGQYASHAIHTHYFPHSYRRMNHVTACTVLVAPFVSGSVNTKDLLQLEQSLHPCQCEQPRVSFVWGDEI